MSKRSSSSFRFRRSDHIGAADAEHDTDYLSTCFVDTGDLHILEDGSDHRQILLGRTGSGKSALLEKLKLTHRDQVITIEPENLALTYVSNSTILQFFSNIGVNLDPFFKLLWRHVFTVELLNRHFSNFKQVKQQSVLEKLKNMFSGNSRKDREMNEAIQYLQLWGERFWEQTEFRVKEITSKLEDSLKTEMAAEFGVSAAKVKGMVQSSGVISEEQRSELVTRGQKVVSEAQVQDLHKVIKLLDSVLEDRQKQYYVVIDKIDENWVEERLRYKLIMALILTSSDFFRVKNAKVILAMRRDLIERVFRLTRQSGFQEEKFQSLYLPLEWSKQDLIKVLDERIQKLVSHRYTGRPVTHIDLLPKKYKKKPITEYISEITARPRDIVAFFNSCIAAGTNLAKLSSSVLSKAEGEYSRQRLRALGDEWSADFPSLLDFTKVLMMKPPSFKLQSVEDKQIEELCLNISADKLGGDGILQQYAMKVTDVVTSPSDFKVLLFQVFYRVGLVGLKVHPHESASWADELGRAVSAAEVGPETSVVIHPMYYRVLGVKSNS
ncbi:MAG: hypothetical protein J7K85_04695 [Anaerolineaceae bacterium]|nr:hypothetical protein [Anaerolineaceae bacterium]